ncbi:hypothetical protein FCV25MIE_19811 [Fagus crenata]
MYSAMRNLRNPLSAAYRRTQSSTRFRRSPPRFVGDFSSPVQDEIQPGRHSVSSPRFVDFSYPVQDEIQTAHDSVSSQEADIQTGQDSVSSQEAEIQPARESSSSQHAGHSYRFEGITLEPTQNVLFGQNKKTKSGFFSGVMRSIRALSHRSGGRKKTKSPTVELSAETERMLSEMREVTPEGEVKPIKKTKYIVQANGKNYSNEDVNYSKRIYQCPNCPDSVLLAYSEAAMFTHSQEAHAGMGVICPSCGIAYARRQRHLCPLQKTKGVF